MTDAPPPPPDLPADVAGAIDELDPESLRRLSRYAEGLADSREREAAQRDDAPDDAEDRPADVPGKATVTVKEINDNRYYYWQWREGDRVRSKYKGPVDPDD